MPAGKWISQVLADSSKGNNVICHSFIPNVTVNFEKIGGNSITLRWDKALKEHVPEWRIYIHDKHEHVVLASYAMSDLPYVTLKKSTEEKSFKFKHKTKLMPKLKKRPNTNAHKCIENRSYSQDLCYLKLFWTSRVNSLKEFYGSRFNCSIPGILANYRLPICSKASAGRDSLLNKGNGTIGYLDLINIEGTYGADIVRYFKV